MKFNKDMKS